MKLFLVAIVVLVYFSYHVNSTPVINYNYYYTDGDADGDGDGDGWDQQVEVGELVQQRRELQLETNVTIEKRRNRWRVKHKKGNFMRNNVLYKTSDYEHPARHGSALLSFASYYGDHMVLQQAPKAACIWGYATASWLGHELHVMLTSTEGRLMYQTIPAIIKRSGGNATWFVKLSPVPSGGPYTITVAYKYNKISITDVVFGDVWICSGQSNMQFTTSQLFKRDRNEEYSIADSHLGVRVFTASLAKSNVSLLDLEAVKEPWRVASSAALNGGPWAYFSAMCWLYGRRLYETLGYPIGLVASDFGGSPIKAWSSPDALKSCGNESKAYEVDWHNSELWNAMMHPLVNMTIYGAIWYQGEADASSRSKIYYCRFPAMIRDWRSKFHEGSLGETSLKFPFGFVQLAPWHNTTRINGFPSIRWQQTANRGYVPNSDMPHVFMAVAMDLPDFSSPSTPIHPRYKETLANRLYLAGMNVAYGVKKIKCQGPRPTGYSLQADGQYKDLRIEFDNRRTIISVLGNNGFELCCSSKSYHTCPENSKVWVKAPIMSHDFTSVTVSMQACEGTVINAMRYNWRETPCHFKRCAVYSVENSLPAPPLLTNMNIRIN